MSEAKSSQWLGIENCDQLAGFCDVRAYPGARPQETEVAQVWIPNARKPLVLIGRFPHRVFRGCLSGV